MVNYIRDIHSMGTNVDPHMRKIEDYGAVAALEILLGGSLRDSRPQHSLSWLMLLENALSSFMRMKGQYFIQISTASSQNPSVYRTLKLVPIDAIVFKYQQHH